MCPRTEFYEIWIPARGANGSARFVPAGHALAMHNADRDALLVHGTCVALGPDAALIRGAPGAGKSDLALRFLFLPREYLGATAALVADDRTVLTREGTGIGVSAPAALAGMIEVRGIGILPAVRTRTSARLTLLVDLDAWEEIPRLPDPIGDEVIMGVSIPKIALNAFQASSALKLALAIGKFGGGTVD